jgi:hypothetical protein
MLCAAASEIFVNPIAAIRLVLATALIFLFSGTMAFAHEGHHHGAQIEQTAKAAAAVIPAKFSAAPATHLSGPDVMPRLNGVVASATSASSSVSGCGHDCCCCGGGASACGMSGCTALGLSAAEQFVPRTADSDKLAFDIADVLYGRSDSGLDRPPKA